MNQPSLHRGPLLFTLKEFYVVFKFSSFVGNPVLSVPVHMHFVKYPVFGSLEDAKF